MSINKIKADILKEYASIHAFCKAHKELARSSVYLALSGRYPGDCQRQLDRIRMALGEPEPERLPVVSRSEGEITEQLQAIRCAHCRRLNRRECVACRDQTEREARELYIALYGGEAICQTALEEE